MRLLIIALLVGSINSVSAQNYYTGYELFDLLDDCSNYNRLFDSLTQPFQISQYHASGLNDTLEFVGGCAFSVLRNGVIRTSQYSEHKIFGDKSYWKWQESAKGEDHGFVLECNKKGVSKQPTNSFYSTTINITETDSVVDQIKWRIGKHGDTSCQFLYRWIYRNDSLMEYWQQYIDSNECKWSTQPSIRIQVYLYPKSNVRIREFYYGSIHRRKLHNVYKEEKTYDTIGRMVSFRVLSQERANDQTEYRYLYDKRQCIARQQWYNGKLIEVITIQQLTSTKQNSRVLTLEYRAPFR